MAKISTYVIDSTPQLNDKVIGTDVNDNNITKNYTIGDIISLVPPIPSVVTDLFVPISNGVDYVDSVITQDSTTAPTKINVNGLIGITGTGQSVYIGDGAGVSDAFTFGKNVGVGQGALSSFTAGFFGQDEDGVNIAIGHNALNATTTGTNNIAIGGGSLAFNVQGFNNVAISKNALGDDTVQYIGNNTSIGVGFSAGNPSPTSLINPNFVGHVGGVYVGHQAFADFSVDENATTIEGNTVIGRRAFRNAGLGGDKRLTSFEKNTIIGDNAAINLDTAVTINDTPFTVSENIYIGRNAGANNDPGSNSIISGNVIIGKLFGGSHDIGNIVISAGSTGNKTNSLGVAGAGATDSTIARNNIILGSNNKVFGNNNIAINMYSDGQPSDPSQVQIGQNVSGGTAYPTTENVVLGSYAIKILEGAAEFANKNTLINSQAIKIDANGSNNSNNNLVLNSFGSSPADPTIIQGQNNTLLNASSFAIGGQPLVGNDNFVVGTSGSAIAGANSSNNVILGSSTITMVSANDTPITGNVVVNGSTITLTNTLAATDSNNTRNNYVLGCRNIEMTDSGRNFIFASEFSNPTSFEFNNHNFLFGITSFNGAQQSSISSGSDYNFLFNADDVTLSGASNVVFGQMSATIDGDKNTILNASGTVTGNSNVVLAGTQHTVSGSNNIVSGNSCRTQSSTARSLNIGNNNDIGSSGAANNSVAIGNNIDISSGANNAAFGNGITVTSSTNSFTVGKNNDDSKVNTQGNPCLQVGVGQNLTARRNALNIVNTSGPLFGVIYMDQLVAQDYPNDADAAAAGIGLGGLYHTAGVVRINITP